MYLRDKYSVVWAFGQRGRPSVPTDCSQEEVMADVALCEVAHQLRATLQKLRDVRWPQAPVRPQLVSGASFFSDDSSPPPVVEVATFKPRARVVGPTRVLTSVAPISVPAPVPIVAPSPGVPYDVASCDRLSFL